MAPFPFPKQKHGAAASSPAAISTNYLTPMHTLWNEIWVDPSPVMWYPDDLGRGCWDWEGQESALLQTNIPARPVWSRAGVRPLSGTKRVVAMVK